MQPIIHKIEKANHDGGRDKQVDQKTAKLLKVTVHLTKLITLIMNSVLLKIAKFAMK